MYLEARNLLVVSGASEGVGSTPRSSYGRAHMRYTGNVRYHPGATAE